MAHLEGDRSRSAPEPERALLNEAIQGRSPLGAALSAWARPARWLPLAVALVALALWQLAAGLQIISPLFFPPPSQIARVSWSQLLDGALTAHIGATLSRLGLGMLAGGLAGYLLGLLMGWSRRLEMIVNPFISAAHPVPKIAILPLFLVIFGIGETSRVLVVALGAFFPMLVNSMAGVRQIHAIHFEVARNYDAGWLRTLLRVVLPGSLPLALAGLRLALNVALLITISVEIIGAPAGLGSMIWRAWQTMRTEELYASLAVIMALGILFNLLVNGLSRCLMPWQAGRHFE